MQSVTGHKSISSLAIYQRTSLSQKMDMAQTLHSKIAGAKQNTQPTRSQVTVSSVEHAGEHAVTEMEDTISAGGKAEIQLRDIDLNSFFSKENEPSSSGAKPLFQNCKLEIQNFTINIIKK